MNKVFKCPICIEQFNTPTKTPLTLPCGDVICKECLVSLTASSTHSIFTCPIHKTSFHVNINSLPICKTILQYLPMKKPKEFVCKIHPLKKIKYFCAFDNDALCSKCLASHSNQSQHKIAQFTPTKIALSNEISFVTERISERLLNIKTDSQMNSEYKNILLTHTKEEIKTLETEFNRIINQITSTKNRILDKVNNVSKYQLDMLEEKSQKFKEQEEKCLKTKKSIDNFRNQLNKSDVIYDDAIELKKQIIHQWEIVLKNSSNLCLGTNSIVLPKIQFNNTKCFNDYKNLFSADTLSYQLAPANSNSLKNTSTTLNNEEYLMLRNNNTNETCLNNQSDNNTRANTKESSHNSNSNNNNNCIRSNSSKNTQQNITNRRKFSEPIETNTRMHQERKSVNKPIMINKEINLLRELTNISITNANNINYTYDNNQKSKGDISDRRFDTLN